MLMLAAYNLASKFELNAGTIVTPRPISIQAPSAGYWESEREHIDGKAIIEHASVWDGRQKQQWAVWER
jgi:hypothetical protein